MICIMSAMPEEIEGLLVHVKDAHEETHGGRTYHVGALGTHDVVIVFSRWGKVAAASTATTLIEKFAISQLIFTGVAGATTPALNIGDVVIADKLYQHDMDARPLYQKHHIPLTDVAFFKTDDALRAKALCAADHLFTHFSDIISPTLRQTFHLTQPACHVGVVATGDQFIHQTSQTQRIMKDVPETFAVEMEGAAVAQVCDDHALPFIIIRTISDTANHASNLDFCAFVQHVARYYSVTMVLSMLDVV